MIYIYIYICIYNYTFIVYIRLPRPGPQPGPTQTQKITKNKNKESIYTNDSTNDDAHDNTIQEHKQTNDLYKHTINNNKCKRFLKQP